MEVLEAENKCSLTTRILLKKPYFGEPLKLVRLWKCSLSRGNLEEVQFYLYYLGN